MLLKILPNVSFYHYLANNAENRFVMLNVIFTVTTAVSQWSGLNEWCIECFIPRKGQTQRSIGQFWCPVLALRNAQGEVDPVFVPSRHLTFEQRRNSEIRA